MLSFKKEMPKSIAVGLLTLSVLCPLPAMADLDGGDKIMTTQIVIDEVELFATEELGNTGDDMRFSSRIAQTGHHPRNDFLFVFGDNGPSGVEKSDFLANGEGNTQIIGKLAYFHVECTPCSKINTRFDVWEDDGDLSQGDLFPLIEEGLSLAFDIEGNSFWSSALGQFIEILQESGLFKNIDARSTDNELVECPTPNQSGSATHDASLIITSDEDQNKTCCGWEEGDTGARVGYTIQTVVTNISCQDEQGLFNNEGYDDVIENFLDGADLDEKLQDTLKEKFGLASAAKRLGDQPTLIEATSEIDVLIQEGLAGNLIAFDDGLRLIEYKNFLLTAETILIPVMSGVGLTIFILMLIAASLIALKNLS